MQELKIYGQKRQELKRYGQERQGQKGIRTGETGTKGTVTGGTGTEGSGLENSSCLRRFWVGVNKKRIEARELKQPRREEKVKLLFHLVGRGGYVSVRSRLVCLGGGAGITSQNTRE